MSLDILAVHDQITAKLRSEISQDVYETAVPEDVKISHGATGLFNPYVVITYGDMVEASGSAGIISTRYNMGNSYCIISCVGPTERSSRQVANLVRDALVGFAATDSGEMRLAGGRNYIASESNAGPNKYVADLNFIFPVNTVW